MKQSPTPRTAAHQMIDGMAHDHLWRNFAETLELELQEANDYADRLVEHKDMVCLPADLKNLREANAHFATENELLKNTIANDRDAAAAEAEEMKELQHKVVELEKILKDCLYEMPCNYVPNHTVEKLPLMIQSQAQLLAEEITHSEKLEKQRNLLIEVLEVALNATVLNHRRDRWHSDAEYALNKIKLNLK